MAEKVQPWDQANRWQKLGLVCRNRKKISQIFNAYLYLPFFLLTILWSHPVIWKRKQVRRCRDKTNPAIFGISPIPPLPPLHIDEVCLLAPGAIRRIYSCAILGWGGGGLMDIFGWCQQLNSYTGFPWTRGPFSTLPNDKFMAHAANITLWTRKTKQFFYLFPSRLL